MNAQPAAAERPAISVVLLAYNSRSRIAPTLRALRAQDLDEPHEVIVVASGEDGCAPYLRAEFPEVRVLASARRLLPGETRNRGVAAAEGDYIAFSSDDVIPVKGWLRARLAAHRRGYDAVGGSVTNRTPWHPIGSAGYYLEYSAMIPSARILAEQSVPHGLSFRRSLLERIGGFPEDVTTGEDTVAGKRCRELGAAIGFEPAAAIAHRNPRRPSAYLRHQFDHGRGLVRCMRAYGIDSPLGDLDRAAPVLLWHALVVYPARRWWRALGRLARGRRRWVPGYLLLSPIVWAGLWAVSAGALIELRAAEGEASVAG